MWGQAFAEPHGDGLDHKPQSSRLRPHGPAREDVEEEPERTQHPFILAAAGMGTESHTRHKRGPWGRWATEQQGHQI